MFIERLDPGLKVVSTQSPIEALQRFGEERFDCAIVNYLMPRMDGIELARRIRERSSIPIIIYTGQGTEEIASQAFAVGVDDYVRKELDPSHYQVLARRIRAAVERHHARELVRYLNRALRAIRSVNQFIIREKDHDKLLMGACELLVQTGSYYDAWVLLLEGDGRSTFTSNVELTDALERMVELTRCGEPPGCVRRALERSGAHAISLPDPACAGCPMADRYIDRSALICRLGYGGKVYGLLTVTAPLKMVGDYEKELFQEIAGDISFALYAIDLDEKRRRAELGVREAEEKFRGIIERSIDIIYIVDTKGRITFVSPSVEEILGYKSEEVLGKPLFDFVQESDRRRAMDAFAEALEGTIAQGFITEAICKDHGRVFVQILTSPLEVEGEIVGFQGFVRDITGIVNRQRRLEALHRNVLELSSARTTKEVADSTFRN
ncbi:MAG: PAS domain S-box protein, partial [Candidatus Bathyarchaeia archaeon]